MNWIPDECHKNIPFVKTISTCASVSNVNAKADGELKRGTLITSPWDWTVLPGKLRPYVNEGHTRADAWQQLIWLDAAGISYSLGILLGLPGAGHGQKTGRINGGFFQGLKADHL